jgi:trehalose 6-phosphate synthase/phosphatase
MPGRVLIVSNRLPVSVRWRSHGAEVVDSVGGLATGLKSLVRQEHVRWIGWPGQVPRGSASDVATVDARLRTHGFEPLHLSPSEVEGYYDGFSNGVLWPLFHYLLDRIPVDSGGWQTYCDVNAKFADVVLRHWQPGDRIWIHDYHLMVLPSLLRERLPDARIGFFLHIPFPALDVFRALPWRTQVLEGLLGADVIGFHTPAYARHFSTAVGHLTAVEPTANHVWWNGRTVQIGVFPIGIDEAQFRRIAGRPETRARTDAIRAEAGGRKILLGVDRLDYTKGIPRRLVAFQRLLERKPEWRDRVRFIQVAVPSRVDVYAYKNFQKELHELVGRINGTFGTVGSVPIHYVHRSLPIKELVALYRAADVMAVTPLRDGMNLVAKEFVASRVDDDGVLLLSEFAGAANELLGAVVVNPYDVDGVADAMATALSLARNAQAKCMRALREQVQRGSVQSWVSSFLDALGTEAARPAVRETSSGDALSDVIEGRKATAGRIVLLLDYDGTLVPYASSPELAVPDSDLLNLLAALAANPMIDLHLVSGRGLENVNRWFWHLPAGLWAEHGAACRLVGRNWQRLVAGTPAWKDRVRSYLQSVSAATPGAIVEEKSNGLAWHYRMVDPALAAERVQEVRRELAALIENASIDLLEGHMVLELRPLGVSKALIVRQIHASLAQPGLFVAMGDDRTDEEMFGALPAPSTSIHVGPGPSRAQFRLPDWRSVRQFLADLLHTSQPRHAPPRRAIVSEAS